MTGNIATEPTGSLGPVMKSKTPRRNMDILIFLGLFVLWIVLQVWVLPKLGVPT
jgi:hypothetical protein